MKIEIEKTALVDLKNEMKKSEKNAIKIFVSTVKCSGPLLSLAFYNKKEEDKIISAYEIDFYLDNNIEEFGDSIEITKREGFGGGYTVKFSNVDNASCPV